MKYLIYIRVSTDDQHLGVEAQRHTCMEYICKHKDVPYLEFIDEDRKGTLEFEKRPALREAIQSLKKGDVLLVARRCRLGRAPLINALIEREIEKKRSSLITVLQDDSDMDKGQRDFFKTMLDAAAKFEVYLIGVRVKDALGRKKHAKQVVGHVPYGYSAKPDPEKITKHNKPLKWIIREPIEQSTLEYMIQLRDQGRSLREIAEHLSETGRLNREGNPWNHVSIYKILKNVERHRAVC